VVILIRHPINKYPRYIDLPKRHCILGSHSSGYEDYILGCKVKVNYTALHPRRQSPYLKDGYIFTIK
jgi:hypothetical protein